MPQRLDEPIFLIGMGRSGSTLLFEVVAASPELGWFSRYVNLVPGVPAVAAASRLADVNPVFRASVPPSSRQSGWRRAFAKLERLRLGPTEGYRVWNHYCAATFADDFLAAQPLASERRRMSDFVSRLLRYQGKQRLVAKLTGPPRVAYLSEMFPGARFIHLVRDGRAVVRSLLRVPYWRDTFRLRQPAWKGALTGDDLARWESLGRSPVVLAALEWQRVLECARTEAAHQAPGRYVELRYEDFLTSPHRALDEMADFCDLPRSPRVHAFLARRYALRSTSKDPAGGFTPDDQALLDDLLGATLRDFDYAVANRQDEPTHGDREGSLLRAYP